MKNRTVRTVKFHDLVMEAIDALREKTGQSLPEFFADDPRVTAWLKRHGLTIPPPGPLGRPRKIRIPSHD